MVRATGFVKVSLAVVVCLALVGCGKAQPQAITLDTAGISPAVEYRLLGGVLHAAIRDDGEIRKDALARQAETLDKQLKLLAVTGPSSTPGLLPTEDDVLAYWYNARAAWSLKLLLLADCPEQFTDDRLLLDRTFPLDGRTMTLRQIDALLENDRDWRVLAGAPDVLLSRSAMPRQPYSAGDIRPRIVTNVRNLVDDDRRFVVDVMHRSAAVPPVLWQMRQRIVEEYERTYGAVGATFATALLPHLEGSSSRKIHDAAGYAFSPISPPWKTAVARRE